MREQSHFAIRASPEVGASAVHEIRVDVGVEESLEFRVQAWKSSVG